MMTCTSAQRRLYAAVLYCFLCAYAHNGFGRMAGDDDGPRVPLPPEYDMDWEPATVWTSIRHHEPGTILQGSSAIHVSFRDRSDGELGYRVYRSSEGSRRVLIRSYGPQDRSIVQFMDGEDESLAHNTRYCYTVEAYNEYATNTGQHCAITGVVGINPYVLRAQIEFKIGSVEDAGTDSAIGVRLNGRGGAPRGNHTWLDWGTQ